MSDRNLLFKILIFVSMIIWGGSWVSAKVISTMVPVETITFWRFLINFFTLLPLFFFDKDRAKINAKAFAYISLGAISMGVYFYLFFTGLKIGFAGASGVLVTTMVPLVTYILSVLFLKHKILKKDLIGLFLGFIGGLIILEVWSQDLNKIFMQGNIIFLVCAILWACLTVSSQKASVETSPLIFSIFVCAICSIIFFLLAIPKGILLVFNQGSLFWLNMFYLAIISSSFATTVYFYAISHLTSFKASSFIFLVPSSAIFFSWIFLNEIPKISTIAGGLTAISAIYLIND